MNAYILIWVDVRKLDDIRGMLVSETGIIETRFPATPWDIHLTLTDYSEDRVNALHDAIQKMDGVTSTAVAFEKEVKR